MDHREKKVLGPGRVEEVLIGEQRNAGSIQNWVRSNTLHTEVSAMGSAKNTIRKTTGM